MKRKLTILTLVLSSAVLAVSGWTWQRYGLYGFNAFFQRGGSYWIRMDADDASCHRPCGLR